MKTHLFLPNEHNSTELLEVAASFEKIFLKTKSKKHKDAANGYFRAALRKAGLPYKGVNLI